MQYMEFVESTTEDGLILEGAQHDFKGFEDRIVTEVLSFIQ